MADTCSLFSEDSASIVEGGMRQKTDEQPGVVSG